MGVGWTSYDAPMNRWKALGFTLVFLVPAQMPLAAWLSAHTAFPNAMCWTPLVFLFVLLPAFDYLLGRDPANVPADAERETALNPWFRTLTLLALPVQVALLVWSAWWFVHADLSWIGVAGWLLSQGLVGGILAINTAHELIHKDAPIERLAGGLLLTSVGYHGFKVEHLRGHHVHVATPADASSARLGQSLWHFMPRGAAAQHGKRVDARGATADGSAGAGNRCGHRCDLPEVTLTTPR